MSKIILCFNLNNDQTDFSALMQIIQALESENSTVDYEKIKSLISIQYCWIREEANIQYKATTIVNNIEKSWFGNIESDQCDNSNKRNIWEPHKLSQLKELIMKKRNYEISYYIRVRNDLDKDIKNIQYLVLILQQFPSVIGRIQVFLEPFEGYMSADGITWKAREAYYKYSHYMRFILKRYRNIFYSAFFKDGVNIAQLSSKKKGVQSTFFPLVEVDNRTYDVFTRYVRLKDDGTMLEKGEKYNDPELNDLVEISKRIMDSRLNANIKLKKEREKKASYIYYLLSLKNMTVLEYAIFSELIPISEGLGETEIKGCQERAASISNGLVQIMENIILHSYNHKGIFTFRIIHDGKEYLNNILNNELREGLNEILEIDVVDTNIYETIIDNFSNKLGNKENYFSDIHLSVSHFFKKYEGDKEEKAWENFRKENPVRCMGLMRLKQELMRCEAVLRVRSDTSYNSDDELLAYEENDFSSAGFKENKKREFIPGTQFQIIFPVLKGEYKKQHNANIFLKGYGNLVERDEYYTDFIDHHAVSLECYMGAGDSGQLATVAELDRFFYKEVLNDDSRNNKEQMVGMWTEKLDEISTRIDPDEKKVYFLDLDKANEMESPWGSEALCKGIADSKILYNGAIKYLALIHCNEEFVQMMFDTIMMSGKKLHNNLQIYLHADNSFGDLIISGKDQKTIVKNAIQFCYLRGETPKFLESYEKLIHDGVSNDKADNDEVRLFPFDVIIDQEKSGTTLFEEYINNVAQRSLTASDEAGYLLSHAHMRLGNKVHLDKFYEISILFRKPRIARKIALLIIRRMAAEGVDLNCDLLFYGYASYSRAILSALYNIMGGYQKRKHFIAFAVYQNDIMVQKTLTHISPTVKMYFSRDIPAGINVNIIQIVPISSTLTTFKKMWEMFKESDQLKCGKHHLVKNYTLFWVKDLEEENRENEPTEIEQEYWEKIGDKKSIKTTLIEPYPQFFCYKEIQWFNPLNCKQCYPENVLDEIALVETDVTSTVPSQQLEVDLDHQTEERDEQHIINEIRIIHLKNCIYYGHISRDGNHYQYYIDTTKYFHKQETYIKRWLQKLREDQSEKSNTLNIIVTPQHHTNVEFGQYVNDYYFDGNADFITIDPTKEYRSNIIAKYADVKAAVSSAAKSGIYVKFIYVDDTIITGSTYKRVNSLLHSLVPAEIQKPIQFEKVFVLVNRMSFCSKMDYVEDVEKNFHSFVNVNISSVRNFGDSCAMCMLQRNSELFFKRSSTISISKYWNDKQYGYRAVSFDQIIREDSNKSEEQRNQEYKGYFRMLCSHYAKEHLDIGIELNESILSIIRLMSDAIQDEESKLKKDRLEPSEENAEFFVSKKVSPIYCCVFKRNELETIKAYLKVLCRPFFSYGKIYRQAVMDLFLMLSECFLDPGFEKKLVASGEQISSQKQYLNDESLRQNVFSLYDFLRKRIVPAEERVDFIQKYLMEGLTDLRSNYIIRLSTINHYKEMISDKEDTYNYIKYERMIHKLVNSSADETKSLWLEYLLITGRENTTSLNSNQGITLRHGDIGEKGFPLFWDSLLIENTRLYYDSMLNFVQKAADIKKEDMSTEEAIKKAVDSMWGDYYIKNLRRFIKIEILADTDPIIVDEKAVDEQIRDRVIKTANLLYLLKKGTLEGIDRYTWLKDYIENLLYEGDKVKILTSASAGEGNEDQIYAVTDYKSGNVPSKIVSRVKNAIKDKILQHKSYYLGEGYIILCIDNNKDPRLVKIQPLYFYIECDTKNHFHVILRIRKILMYRHQLLHWIEADFNNNAMPILAEQMGINRQLSRDRAGDHNTSTDILTIEKLLQSGYKEEYGAIYRWLLLKVYVNMRIARLFRSEWGESYGKIRDRVYTLKENEDRMNKAFDNVDKAFFDETLTNLSPKQYFEFVKEIFCFDLEICGESRKNADIAELRKVFGKLHGRCEDHYYYKQEYIICIIFDILFSAIRNCRNWDTDIDKFSRKNLNKPADGLLLENKTIAFFYILQQEDKKCKIRICTEEIPDQDIVYLVFKNKAHNVKRDKIDENNMDFIEKMRTKDTIGMSLQAMKWYTEKLGGNTSVEAKFLYEWDFEEEEVMFVTKLPILSKEGLQ